MSKDNSKGNLVDYQWFDIFLPIAPESDALLWSLISISILLAFSLIGQFLWKRQPRQILYRQIKWLINTSSIKPKQRLRMLEQSICEYYNTAQLSQIPLSHPGWTAYAHTLQKACYQAKIIKHKHARELIIRANAMLRAHL